jgi:putative ABC transport system permease protein
MSKASGSGAIKWQVLWRGLRWRFGSAVMLFVVATLAIAGAAIGPIFLQSADSSVLSGVLASAPRGEANLVFSDSGSRGAERRVAAASRAAVKIAGHGLLGNPILTTDLGLTLTANKGQRYSADVLDRTRICRHLRFVAGRCPKGGLEVALSERSASLIHRTIGERILLTVTEQASVTCTTLTGGTISCSTGPSSTKTTAAVLVGIYQPPSSVDTVYWAGGDYFPYGTGSASEPTLDAIIATTPSVLRIAGTKFTFHKIVLTNFAITFSSSIPWNMASVVRDRGEIRSVIASIRSKLSHDYGQQLSTSLPSEMTAASNDDGTMLPIILSIELQVVLLALLVLYVLGRSSANARRLEADFARRRGFPRSTLLALAVNEPVALVTAALPVGVLVAWLVLKSVASSFFASGTSVTLTWPSIAAGVGGYVAAVLAATLASYSLWRRSGTQTSSRRASVAAIALDAAGVALALAGLIAVTTSGALNGSHTSPLAAIAPGLLALGAAIIGLRLFGFIFSLAVRATKGSRKVAWFLAFRQVARRPEMLRRLLPLTAAVGVVLFAIGAYALAAEDRSSAASFETGADRVVVVTPPSGANFVSDVRAADPSGHQAMAAVLSTAPSGELLAVDSTRLAAVAAWPKRLSRSSIRAIGHELAPPTHPPAMFQGSALRLRIYVSPHTPTLNVIVSAYDPTYEDVSTYNVTVHSGLRDYVVPLGGGCPGTCRLVSVNPELPSGDLTSTRPITFTIEQMSVKDPGAWRPVSFGAGVPGSWRTESSGFSIDSSNPTGVRFTIPEVSLGAGGVIAAPADVPLLFPAVVTDELASVSAPQPPNNAIPYEDLDGTSINLREIAQVPALPNVGQDAALMDLTLADRALTQQSVYTTDEVWLSADASPEILGRLRRDGYTIGSTTTAAARAATLGHTGIASSYDLALVVTPIAALLAVGAVIFATSAEGRRRRGEITSLANARIRRSTIGRSLVLENALILAVALVIGGAIGFGADQLALPSLPQFLAGSRGFPVLHAIPVGTLFAALGAFAGVLALGAVGMSWLILGAALGSPRGRR